MDDLIDLALLVSDSNTSDTVNVSSGTTVSINKIADLICSEMKTDIKPKYAETGHFWVKYPELYEEPYPISNQLMEKEVLKYTCLSNDHAREKYGWTPKTTLADGIKNTVAFSCNVLRRHSLSDG